MYSRIINIIKKMQGVYTKSTCDSTKLETTMHKKETGVMVMKEGKAWGITYDDGHSRYYGWLNPADKKVEMYDSRSCKKIADVTAIYRDRYLLDELKTGKLVNIERTITVKILGT